MRHIVAKTSRTRKNWNSCLFLLLFRKCEMSLSNLFFKNALNCFRNQLQQLLATRSLKSFLNSKGGDIHFTVLVFTVIKENMEFYSLNTWF